MTASEKASVQETKVTTIAEYLRMERRQAQLFARHFVRACADGDLDDLHAVADQMSSLVGAWTAAMRRVARQRPKVSDDVRSAFATIWTRTNMLPLKVGDDRALRAAARILLPSYHGPAVQLFRGAGANERRRRTYGLSWSASRETAERFATERRVMDEGSVLLETLAPAEAIIAKIDYPPPFTNEQIAEMEQQYGSLEIIEYHAEVEYLIDRLCLRQVRVLRHYPQVSVP